MRRIAMWVLCLVFIVAPPSATVAAEREAPAAETDAPEVYLVPADTLRQVGAVLRAQQAEIERLTETLRRGGCI